MHHESFLHDDDVTDLFMLRQALACAESGDPLIASASNTNEKEVKGMAGYREDYDDLIAAARYHYNPLHII